MLNSFHKNVNNKIVLASQSYQRRALLNSIGIEPYKIVSPGIDESIFEKENPRDYVLRVSEQKAKKFIKEYPKHIILAADTIVLCGSRIVDKTQDKDKAQKSLRLLSGRWHKVLSCVVLIKQKKIYHKKVLTRVRFKRLTSSEIKFYIETNEWIGKAGSYAIQGQASAFIIEIKGSYSNVVGLPLYETLSLIGGVGL